MPRAFATLDLFLLLAYKLKDRRGGPKESKEIPKVGLEAVDQHQHPPPHVHPMDTLYSSPQIKLHTPPQILVWGRYERRKLRSVLLSVASL